MGREKNLSERSEEIICEIPYKFPSFNSYVDSCRRNRYSGAKMKKQIQHDIGYFTGRLPRFRRPVKIHFVWVEKDKRRDLDNICYAKKFILDSLVELGKIPDDGQKYVKGFTDTFEHGSETKVILYISEVEK